ncbi:MAG: hypothetical protein K2J15_00900 [Muribaculaceae bacterium]|nr:hypothetical protein [Muribaculaceae bacterium]
MIETKVLGFSSSVWCRDTGQVLPVIGLFPDVMIASSTIDETTGLDKDSRVPILS